MSSSAGSGSKASEQKTPYTPPAVALPKGGGAITSIGEKFAASPVSGAGGLTVPLPLSPGRAGFTPELALRYNSGSGNGPFGFGWTLDLPAITRRTDRGIPRYLDAEESDVFILSGAEDLVPVLREDGTPHVDERDDYRVTRFRPRTEGLFARIERWTHTRDRNDVFWRSISRDNVTSWFGRTPASRIADPHDPARVFSWHVCEVTDDKGNAAVYEYAAEDSRAIDVDAPEESSRSDLARSANRLLKRVKYGNAVSRLQPGFDQTDWLFELVLDYGDHDADSPTPVPSRDWRRRPDPFSSCRAGFEVRTYRRCERLLMFHQFAELGPAPRLVRALSLTYDDLDPATSQDAMTELTHAGSTPIGSFLMATTVTGYSSRGVSRSMPPLEFRYSRPSLGTDVRTVESDNAAVLPIGADGRSYRWVDLDGEGLNGVLSEQGGAWWYAPNHGGGRIGLERPLSAQPASAGSARVHLLDLAGDGSLDLVQLDRPVAGFFERSASGGWTTFQPFAEQPNVSWTDPNLRFVDLTGDGHADVLITEDDVLAWHPSLAESGYGPREASRMAPDEAMGPRLLLQDDTGTVFLADMNGDGLSDLVRVRNGEVCYWPSLGYGRFGARVTMHDAPVFDAPDLFSPRRLTLADVDGSGVADLIYLAADGVRLYFNRSGNGWTPEYRLPAFPGIDDHVDVTVTDLLGNGTACLVWSSGLPRDRQRPMRFVDLMGGKPHLLTAVANNLGTETTISYCASTKFYLEDRRADRPWPTRLPFPVHVVERVETHDRISRNRFTTRYAYHDGYFDGVEREFRGFGMVEQWDTEEFGALSAAGALTESSNLDAASHVPPVLTRTWFHTGTSTSSADSIVPADLTADEEREAWRTLKGSLLRQDVFAVDGTDREPHPYSSIEHTYAVRCEQRQGVNRHAVFLPHSRESISSHIERVPDDPRVAHRVTLEVGAFGDLLTTAAVAYGRRHSDPALSPEDQQRQAASHITVTETTVTNVVDLPDAYRVPASCESRSYELTGLVLPDGAPRFTFDELKHAAATSPFIAYTDAAAPGALQRRLVERSRTFFRRDDCSGPLPFGQLESLALPFDSLALTMTAPLVADRFGGRVTDAMLTAAGYVHDDGDADWWIPSGRIFYSPHEDDDPATELAFARAHFFLPLRFRNPFHSAGASTEFVARYDAYDLLLLDTRDAAGNTITAGERDAAGAIVAPGNDYHSLHATLITDANGNRRAVAIDALGVVVGAAVMGKRAPAPREGDSLEDFDPDLDEGTVLDHLTDPYANPDAVLGEASSRTVYDRFAFYRTKHDPDPKPPVACALVREKHVAELDPGEQSPIQQSFSYSDGFGREIQRKVEAEAGPVPERDADGRIVLDANGVPVLTAGDHTHRWITSGWIVFNNKGNSVRQYEPFFTDRHAFEFDVRAGVSPVLFYDPPGRVIGVLAPNHTWEKVRFDAWRQETWDASDTVLIADPAADPDLGDFFRRLAPSEYLPTWHGARAGGGLGPEGTVAATRAAAHAATPTVVYADALGRSFLSVTHNRTPPAPPNTDAQEEFARTRSVFDIEGNLVAVVDALDRVVLRDSFDMRGTALRRQTLDAGERWTLVDIAGQPLYQWDSRGFRLRTEYDTLRRPLRVFLREGDAAEQLVQQTDYGEGVPDAETRNLRGMVAAIHDQAGVVTNARFDFNGSLLEGQRQFVRAFKGTVDWASNPPLEPDVFVAQASYDALARPTSSTTADGSIHRTTFNRAGLLEQVTVQLSGESAAVPFVTGATYDARGQRIRVEYGNDTTTAFEFDRHTRLLTSLATTRDSDTSRLQDLRFVLDPVGNVLQIADRAQQDVFFDNQVVAADSDFVYDARYRLISATGREHAGQLAEPQSSVDDEFRTNLPHRSDGQAMRRYHEQYAYDVAGNILRLHHDAGTGTWARHFTYAEPSLLEPGRTGNRLSRTAPDAAGSNAETYRHDAHGNMTDLPHLSIVEWNFADRLQRTSRQVVTSGTPESTYYVYNGEGDRVRKVTERANGTRKAERIYLDGFERYREYDATGTNVILERQTLHVKDDRRRVALIERRTRGSDGSAALLTRYQLGNHLGSASLELDPDAQVISYEEYTPYGSTSYQGVRAATPSAKRYRYSAKERDAETGLYYYGARYYAPWLCRWTASDPVGIKDGVNTYWSFHDNPVLFVDPDGRDKVPANFVEYASDIESGLNRMAQLGLEDGIEYGLAHDPKTNKLMVLRGTRTEISFGRLTPLGHSHTGNDTTVAPSTADLNEFAKKKVKEHWLFSTEDGWARLRYDAKTKTFDVLLNRGKNAVRLTIMQNPKFNRKDKSPIGQASRWLTTVDDPKGEFEVAPPQSRGSAGPVKAPGISWGRWGMRAVFGVEVAATAVVLWNRYSKIVDADRSANDPTYSRTRQAIQQDVTVGAILTGIATTSPAARRGIGAAGNFFLAMEVGKLIFGEDDTIREDPMTGREIRWIYVDDPQVKGMKIGTPHVIDSKTKEWAPAIMSGPGWYTQRELDEMNDPWR